MSTEGRLRNQAARRPELLATYPVMGRAIAALLATTVDERLHAGLDVVLLGPPSGRVWPEQDLICVQPAGKLLQR